MSPRRRGNGEGSIFHETDQNRWVGTIELGIDDEGKRIRRKVTGKTRTAVADKLRAIRNEELAIRRGSDVRTLGDLLERWLAVAAASRLGEGTTLDNYRAQVVQHIKPALGRRRLDQLGPEHIDDYLLSKARAGYSRSTCVRHRSIIGQALRWGVKRRHVSWDVASLAEMPPADVFANAKPKRVRIPRALTADEARSFIAATKDRRNGVALVIGLTLGLRPGEFTALSWDDVDLETGVLQVRQAWKGSGATRHLGDPKTKGSSRSVTLPAGVIAMLHDQRRHQLEDRLRSPEWVDELGLMFTTRTGHPVDSANLRWLTREVAKAAKLGHVTPYDLRHSATSILSHAGVRNEQLADLLGHVDTRMVERHYRHRSTDSVAVAVGPMGDLLKPAQ